MNTVCTPVQLNSFWMGLINTQVAVDMLDQIDCSMSKSLGKTMSHHAPLSGATSQNTEKIKLLIEPPLCRRR